jgi:arsenate reductase
MTEPIKIYQLLHCSTCQRTAAELEARGVRFESRNIRQQPLSRTEVTNLARLAGGVDKLFSRRALAYRRRNLHERTLAPEEMIDLMTEDDTFIRRPIVMQGERIMPGCTARQLEGFLKNA